MKSIRLATLAEAKAILGRDFHGPEEVNCFLDCDLNTHAHWLIPWTVEVLVACQNTHTMILGNDIDRNKEKMTINWFRKRFSEGRSPGFMREHFVNYANFPFSNETTCANRYYLIPKKIPSKHPSREARTEEAKLHTLQPNEIIEPAVVYIYASFLHFLATREKMYPYDYVLTADRGAGGRVIRVGHLEYNAHIYIGVAQPGMIYNMLGIAPSIKPEIVPS